MPSLPFKREKNPKIDFCQGKRLKNGMRIGSNLLIDASTKPQGKCDLLKAVSPVIASADLLSREEHFYVA
ncbi:MAG: hypothetical protein IPK79_04015 [Vampirovibrionales bacterium]|nr:hypothetical protein [Vampirovibrionales bacterium]